MRLREFKERQRLDEIAPAIPFLLALFGAAGATISGSKVKQWAQENPKQAQDFVDAVKPQVKDPQSITNPVGNALVKSWNWLTGGTTQKDKVIKNQPPLSVPFKDRTPDAKEIKDKVNYDQYLNTTQGSTTAKKLPSSTLNNIRSSGDAGAGWVKQYDELYKKRSQINKQIAADIKNGLTKQQLDAKYGDNLQNLNRNLNDHLGKVDAFPQSKALKDLETRKIKTLPPIKGLDIKDLGDDKISINGKTYDKDFDADEIKRIIGNPGVGNQVKSVGGGQTGAVSGTKDKGSAGATIGGGGMDIGIKGSGAVSGDKGKSIGSTDKPGEWAGGQEWDLPKSKGETGAQTGTGTITGPEIDIKGTTGTVANTSAKSVATTATPSNVITRSGPPPFVVPITQLPLAKQTRDYDPTKDTDIIYKGKKEPGKISKFKGTDSNPTRNKKYYSDLLKKFS